MNLQSLQRAARHTVLATVIGLTFTAQAAAQSTETRYDPGLDQQISHLINQGQIDAAAAQIAAQASNPAQKQFFIARLLKAQGRLDDAITLLRLVLRNNPNYLNARRELAHTLLLNRDYRAAEHHFSALLDTDSNPQMRQGYRHFINTIHANKPVGISGRFSVLPSTNVNKGTTNTIFDTSLGQFIIDPSAQADSGIGFELGLSGYLRHIPDPTTRLSLHWDVATLGYETRRYNATTTTVTASYEKLAPHGSWRLSPFYRIAQREDDADYSGFGLKAAYQHRLTDQTQIHLSGSHESRNYAHQNYQDGVVSAATLSLSHQITPSYGLAAGVGFERGAPEAAHLQYSARRVFASLSRNWAGGLRGTLGFDLGTRSYKGPYPLTTTSRDDSYSKIQFGLSHAQIDLLGFRPQLNCTHTLNRSNISFYDYTATECKASLVRNF